MQGSILRFGVVRACNILEEPVRLARHGAAPPPQQVPSAAAASPLSGIIGSDGHCSRQQVSFALADSSSLLRLLQRDVSRREEERECGAPTCRSQNPTNALLAMRWHMNRKKIKTGPIAESGRTHPPGGSGVQLSSFPSFSHGGLCGARAEERWWPGDNTMSAGT